MSRKYVLDSSVVVRAFLPDRCWHEDAKRILALLLAGDIAVVAPKNARYEFCGVITKTFRKRRRSADQALAAIRAFVDSIAEARKAERQIMMRIRFVKASRRLRHGPDPGRTIDGGNGAVLERRLIA